MQVFIRKGKGNIVVCSSAARLVFTAWECRSRCIFMILNSACPFVLFTHSPVVLRIIQPRIYQKAFYTSILKTSICLPPTEITGYLLCLYCWGKIIAYRAPSPTAYSRPPGVLNFAIKGKLVRGVTSLKTDIWIPLCKQFVGIIYHMLHLPLYPCWATENLVQFKLHSKNTFFFLRKAGVKEPDLSPRDWAACRRTNLDDLGSGALCFCRGESESENGLLFSGGDWVSDFDLAYPGM